ncbi:MAG: hypothetical protein ABSF45_21965 [Terriglobia bacterium]|jgi:hypothetical protein
MSKEKLPDPSGHPEPVSPMGELIKLIQYAVSAVVGVGGFLILASAFLSPTMGATRSAQLRWEERKRQTQEAADRAARDPKPAKTRHER